MNFKILYFLLVSLLVIIACEGDDLPLITGNGLDFDEDEFLGEQYDEMAQAFNERVKNLMDLNYPNPVDPAVVLSADSTRVGDDMCTTMTVKYGPEHDVRYLLDPTSEILYPSCILKGGSVVDGSFTPIIEDRDTITISCSLRGEDGTSASIAVADPKLSTMRDGINKLVSNIAPQETPAGINFKIHEVQSLEQLHVSAGINVKAWGAKLDASYNFNSTEYASRFLVAYDQKYYTIDMDLPRRPSDLFDNYYPTNAELGSSSPVYISSITYGRMVYFMVESTHSSSKTSAALDAAFKDNSIDFDFDKQEIINSSKISALVIGGSSDLAIKAMNGVEGLQEYIEGGANFSPQSPGVPIFYTLRHLKDNSIAKLVLKSTYTLRECVFHGDKVMTDIDRSTLHYLCPDKVDGDGWYQDGVEISGSIRLYKKNNDREIWVKIEGAFEGNRGSDKATLYYDQPLWTAPVGKSVAEIGVTNLKSTFRYIDKDDDVDFGPNGDIVVTDGDFIHYIRVVGDGRGQDLPCDRTEDRSNFQIWFKPFPVTLRSI